MTGGLKNESTKRNTHVLLHENMRGKRFRRNSMKNDRKKDREKEIVCKIRERKEKKPPLSPRNESNQVFN